MRAKLALLGPALILTSLLAWSAQEPPPPPPAPPATGAPGQVPPGSGTGSEVTLELKRNQRPLIRLAFPAFRSTAPLSPAEAATAGREIEATVRQDLIFSG